MAVQRDDHAVAAFATGLGDGSIRTPAGISVPPSSDMTDRIDQAAKTGGVPVDSGPAQGSQ